MPERITATLVANRVLAPHTFVLRLSGCAALAETLPGQFVMLAGADWGNDPLLPRAFSLLAIVTGGGPDDDGVGRGEVAVDILVKTTGKASQRLEHALPGAGFSLLGPLGRAFPAPDAGRRDFLVAGGVGLAPLMMQAALAGRLGLADRTTLFYGGRSADDLVLLDDVAATGVSAVLATEDGTRGTRGYVTAALEQALDRDTDRQTPPTLMACGPEPMLEAVAALAHRRGLPAYLSLEGEMACGIGACLVCAVPCATRPYRYTCVDGPVFDLAELRGPYAAPTS
ncbi:MAG: dihydroorotate dehydrogenase electron transfer subunit [Myxococcota bacterium]